MEVGDTVCVQYHPICLEDLGVVEVSKKYEDCNNLSFIMSMAFLLCVLLFAIVMLYSRW